MFIYFYHHVEKEKNPQEFLLMVRFPHTLDPLGFRARQLDYEKFLEI